MHTVSFFSFKGGVGRTNLLLNVAYGLAREGAFVVVADWDLHAPGLTVMETLAQPLPEGAEEATYPEGGDRRRGVLDFLDAILDEGAEIPDPRTLARPTRMGKDLRNPSAKPADQGDIWFVPTGRFQPDDENQEYHRQLLRVQGRNLAGWKSRFDQEADVENPVEVLKYFRSRIEVIEHEELGKPDYLLVDSRTGMTEIGDLLMSTEFVDRMVIVAGLNEQNFAGLETVVRGLQKVIPPGDVRWYLTLVTSPVPPGEEELKRLRLSRLDDLLRSLARDLKPGEKEPMPEIHQVPYHSWIALSDEIMLRRFPDSDPAQAALAVTKEVQRYRRWHASPARLKNRPKRAGESESVFEGIVKDYPGIAHAWDDLATCQLRNGDYPAARASYAEAIKLDQGEWIYVLNDAELALIEEDFDRAESRLENATPKASEQRQHAMLKLALALVRGEHVEIKSVHAELTGLNASMEKSSTWSYEDMIPFVERLPDAAAWLFKEWICAAKHEDGADPSSALEAYEASMSS
jgi:hypothetical protein